LTGDWKKRRVHRPEVKFLNPVIWDRALRRNFTLCRREKAKGSTCSGTLNARDSAVLKKAMIEEKKRPFQESSDLEKKTVSALVPTAGG